MNLMMSRGTAINADQIIHDVTHMAIRTLVDERNALEI
jgi:hypothetical protein